MKKLEFYHLAAQAILFLVHGSADKIVTINNLKSVSTDTTDKIKTYTNCLHQAKFTSESFKTVQKLMGFALGELLYNAKKLKKKQNIENKKYLQTNNQR
jgi:6-phosphofructokinase